MEHYALLVEQSTKELNKKNADEFLEITTRLYNENMVRINEELEWFINKFDYKYKDEPWKNSKDSVPRALTKLNGIVTD
jgi:hypothetical protein